MSDRMIKINELIKQQLSQILLEEIEFPEGVIVTITKVRTSKDLNHASVYVSILPEEKTQEVMKILIRNAKALPGILNDKIVLRNVPKLRFYLDDEERKAMEIDDLLDSLK